MAETRKVVPERNKLEATALTKQPVLIDNKDPRFHYEWFSTDPSHPSYAGRKRVKHEIGDSVVGYVVCDAWEVVHAETDPGLELRNPRDDQGKPVDTVARLGDMVMLRTPIENHAKYVRIHDAKVAANSRELTAGSKENFSGATAMTRVVHDDIEINPNDVLKGIG